MQIMILGIFLILHGLVHLLYAGQCKRLFELRPGMRWPDGSWLFSRLLGNPKTQMLGAVLLGLAALGFIAGGMGSLLQQDWWRSVAIYTAAFSSAIYLILWDGKLGALSDQGGIGVLINLAILAVLLLT